MLRPARLDDDLHAFLQLGRLLHLQHTFHAQAVGILDLQDRFVRLDGFALDVLVDDLDGAVDGGADLVHFQIGQAGVQIALALSDLARLDLLLDGEFLDAAVWVAPMSSWETLPGCVGFAPSALR